MRTVGRLIRQSAGVQQELARQQAEWLAAERPDRLFYHPKCLLAVVWGAGFPGRATMVSPIPCTTHPVDRLSAIGIRGNGDYGRALNRLSYWATNWIRAIATHRYAKPHYGQLGGALRPRGILRQMLREERTFYPVSEALFPRPSEWPPQAKVVGYHERDKARHWEPEEALRAFMARHSGAKVLFVTFGSMGNDDPKAKTRAVLEALRRVGLPAVVNASWGGLQRPETVPEGVHFVEDVPYDWLFPQVYAVVHHGGAGTTHTALKYGCASMIVPHIVDQYFWNRVVAERGAGPQGMPIKKLTADSLFPKLDALANDPAYKHAAEGIGKRIRAESDRDRLYRTVMERAEDSAGS